LGALFVEHIFSTRPPFLKCSTPQSLTIVVEEPVFSRYLSEKWLRLCAPGRGLPLGNVTSQLFANVYLNELDQFVKHQLAFISWHVGALLGVENRTKDFTLQQSLNALG